MRVVAGTARGRPLVAPPGRTTRPTSDRVREATFNALGSLGAVEGAVVLDLFAGSGALGIEALSRGAAHCTFVDSDAAAVRTVETNLAATGLAGQATVLRRDWTVAAGAPSGPAGAVTLTLLDPPYDFDAWDDLLRRIPGDLAVVESNRAVDAGPAWEMVREKRYGTTVVAVVRRRPVPSPS